MVFWMFSNGTQLEEWKTISYCCIFKQTQDREPPVSNVSRFLRIKITVNAVQAQDCSTVLISLFYWRASFKELPTLATCWYKTNHVGCQELPGAHTSSKFSLSLPAVCLVGAGSNEVQQWLAWTFSQSTWQTTKRNLFLLCSFPCLCIGQGKRKFYFTQKEHWNAHFFSSLPLESPWGLWGGLGHRTLYSSPTSTAVIKHKGEIFPMYGVISFILSEVSFSGLVMTGDANVHL